MTLPVAAEKYGKSANYLRVAANRGTLRAQKVGRDWLVSDEEMIRYIAETKQGRPKDEPKDSP